MDILAGEGTGGTVLGTSQVATITGYNFGGGGGTTTTFTFASPVALTAGSPYTLRIDLVSGNAFVDGVPTNPYAGGQTYLNGLPSSLNGLLSGDEDLYFVEGTRPAAVPEPSPALTFAVAGLGLLGLALRARKRKVIAA